MRKSNWQDAAKVVLLVGQWQPFLSTFVREKRSYVHHNGQSLTPDVNVHLMQDALSWPPLPSSWPQEGTLAARQKQPVGPLEDSKGMHKRSQEETVQPIINLEYIDQMTDKDLQQSTAETTWPGSIPNTQHR